MSINSMTNAALARRADYAPVDDVPRSRTEIARAAAGTSTPENPVTAALAVIVTYIPTEVLTLYVAILAAIRNPQNPPTREVLITFWAFLILTPVIVWAVFAGKLRGEGKPFPAAPNKWPLWEMAAATIAYVAWAFSLPDSPFLASLGLPVTLGSVIVLVTSAALGLAAPLFQQKLPA